MDGGEGKLGDMLAFSGQGDEENSQETLKLWPARLQGRQVSSQPWNPREESISGGRACRMLLRNPGKKAGRMCSRPSSRGIRVDFDDLCKGFTNQRAIKKTQCISLSSRLSRKESHFLPRELLHKTLVISKPLCQSPTLVLGPTLILTTEAL